MRPSASGVMDLRTCAWMVRELGEPVSCTILLEDNSLLAGGWDGRIKHWSDEGDLVWEIQTPNRISSMVVYENCVYSTAGLHLVCIDLKSGQQRWMVALEGSADAVVTTSECILAASSVYDIEHNDFIESAIWVLSFDGELLNTHRMDERPWTLNSFEDGALAGLGRPMNGYAILDHQGNISEQKVDWESPTICATDGDDPVFGLADGSVRSIDGAEVRTLESPVSNIAACANGYIVADDKGRLDYFEETVRWKIDGHAIVGLSSGFLINGIESCWVARWNGSEGHLVVHSQVDGTELASLQGHRIHDVAFNENRVVTGCENGQVFVWDRELLQRRMEQPSQETSDANRSAMFEKLRSLRK